MDVGLEAGEFLVELAGELQVAHDGRVEALARDQQRDARRIGRQQHGGDAAFQLVDRHAVDLAVRHLGEGVGRPHRRLHVGEVHLGCEAGDVARLVHLVDLGAQVLEPDPLVARVLGNELGQHFPQRMVAVVVVLELLQGRHQGVPAALGDADGEHDEEGIEAWNIDPCW